ncbi:MAG: hypothetical protein ACPG5T_00025 [Endozoicomonas sp.]
MAAIIFNIDNAQLLGLIEKLSELTEPSPMIVFPDDHSAREFCNNKIHGLIPEVISHSIEITPEMAGDISGLNKDFTKGTSALFQMLKDIEPITINEPPEPPKKTKHGKFKKRNKEWHRSTKLF